MSTTVIMTNVNNLDNYSSALRRNQHKLYENIKLSPSPLFHQQEDQGIYVDEEFGYNVYKNEIKHNDDDEDEDPEAEAVEGIDDDCEEEDEEEEHDSIILDDAEINDEDKEIEIKVDNTDDKDLIENENEIENDLKTNSNDLNGNLDINSLNNNNNNNNQYPHFEYVSYDKVQDLYEQKKGHFYFIPEGFEPVLVPNDTKAQTVTNLLESTKPVSAVPNVSRMLPDTDVRLPSYALPCGVNAAANAKKNDANNANANKASNKTKKPPRPPNAFILYRRAKQPAIVAKNVGISNNDVSKEIGKMWHEEPVEIRLKYQKMAEAAKEEHTKKYPEYRYRPRRPQERKRRLLTRGKDNVEGSEVGGKAAKRLRRGSAYVLAQRQTVINCNTNMDTHNMGNMNMMMDNNIDNNFSNISNYNYNNHLDSNLYHQNSHPHYNHPHHHQQLLAIQNQPQMYYHQQSQINTAPTTTSNTPSPPLHTNNSFSIIDNDVDNNNNQFTTPTTTYSNDLMEYPIYNQHNQHNFNQHQRAQQNYIDFDSYNHSQSSNFNNQFITKCNY